MAALGSPRGVARLVRFSGAGAVPGTAAALGVNAAFVAALGADLLFDAGVSFGAAIVFAAERLFGAAGFDVDAVAVALIPCGLFCVDLVIGSVLFPQPKPSTCGDRHRSWAATRGPESVLAD